MRNEVTRITQPQCRTIGHSWQFTTVERNGRGYIQGFECGRCGTEKYWDLNQFGELRRTRYRYAEDYLVSGLGSLTPSERGFLRLQALSEELGE